jgi:hypothetical protein
MDLEIRTNNTGKHLSQTIYMVNWLNEEKMGFARNVKRRL